MDGLDRTHGVVVIAATNRLDAIDPALRRSGRFDHELFFSLPNRAQRKQILQVYSKAWGEKNLLSPDFTQYVTDMTEGYSSADVESLCSQAVMCSLKRTYPEISTVAKPMTQRKELKELKFQMKIYDTDLLSALMMTTTSRKFRNGVLRRLPTHIQPLLARQLEKILDLIGRRWPHFLPPDNINASNRNDGRRLCGRMLINGASTQGHNTYIAPAILHALEHLYVQVIDLQAVFEKSSQAAEEVCIEKLKEARQNVPGIFLIYRIDQIWKILQESAKAVLVSILEDLPAEIPLMLIATTTDSLPPEVIIYVCQFKISYESKLILVRDLVAAIFK